MNHHHRTLSRCATSVAAWLVIGAAPPPAPDVKNDNAMLRMSQTLSEIAATLKDTQPVAAQDQGCRAGQDVRRSDLCAQWKAADAAALAAHAADEANHIGWVGIVLGAITMAAAIAAAYFARGAAVETKRGADAAHDANRPWLKVEVTAYEPLLMMKDRAEITATVKVTNCGQSPALYANTLAVLYAERGNAPALLVHGALNKAKEWLGYRTGALKDVDGTAIFPGSHHIEQYTAHIAWEDVKGAIDAGTTIISFAIGVVYHFGEKTGRTISGYEVWPVIGSERVIPIPLHDSSDRRPVHLLDNLSSFAD